MSADSSSVADAKDWRLIFFAWLMALGASLGAVFIGEVMGRTPCDLCWWQRIFMFPLPIIIGLSLFRGDGVGGIYALALALPGTVVAAYHSLLYGGVISEPIRPCTQGVSCSGPSMTILGFPLPYLSLIAFGAICGALFLGMKVQKR